MDNRKKFSEWLQEEIKIRDWSQSDLARYSGLHRAIISKLILNATTPLPDTLHAIAHALRLPPEEVFRAAGILPPAKVKGEKTTLMDHLFEMLPAEDQEDLLALARNKLERQEEKARQAKIKKPIAQTR